MASVRSPETFAFKQQVGFADLETLPKGCFARGFQNADVAHVDDNEANILTIASATIPGARLPWAYGKVTFTADTNDSRNIMELLIYQGGVVIGVSYTMIPPNAGDPVTARVDGEANPGGIYSFRLAAKRLVGTQTVTAQGNFVNPGYLKVMDESPSF